MSGDETEAHEVLRTEIETLRNWNSQKWHGKYQRWSSQKLSNMKLSEMNLGQIRNAPEKGNVETDMETEITLKNWWTSQKFFFQKWIWIKLQGLRKEKGKQTWNRNDIESRMKLSETLLSEINLNQIREPEKGKRETDMETGLPKGYTFKVEVNGLPALPHPIPRIVPLSYPHKEDVGPKDSGIPHFANSRPTVLPQKKGWVNAKLVNHGHQNWWLKRKRNWETWKLPKQKHLKI